VPVQDAGGGEIRDLFDPRRIEQGQHAFHGHHIHLLGPFRVTPCRGCVNDASHACQLRREAIAVAQIAHQKPNARMIHGNCCELGGITQPEEKIGVAVFQQPACGVLADAAAGARDQDAVR
jgi:hypothetical protein